MSFYDILLLLRKHVRALILIPLACAIAMGACAYLFLKNDYTATTSMYVLVSRATQSEGGNVSSALQSDLNSSEKITSDVAGLLTSARVKKQTASQLDLADLSAYGISVESTEGSRGISLSVTGENALLVTEVANGLAVNVSEVAREVMGVEAVNIIDEAETPQRPSGPNRPLYVAIAAANGLVVTMAVLIISDLFNTKIRSEETLEAVTGLPIMGRVPFVDEGGVNRG